MGRAERDEQALLQRLVEGDRTAFEQLFRRHNAGMIRFARAIVRNRAAAEDVVQDTWISVISRIELFEARSSLASWIHAILVNNARSRAKRDGRIVFFDDAGDGDGLAEAFDGRGRWRQMPDLWDALTPDRHVEGRSILQHVEAAMEALPVAQRAVLILRAHQDLDPREVCALLDISEGNMRVLLHRARVTVRNALDRLATDV
ncbi:RNA polymerase sigma-70 factor, ECF subfamily [Rhizobium sp. RU20A]|uniref:RNA polymerase sigma factor n=1 Tax=Rhizobium sp. RU20A TaxID=1907412 RepID=UPI0009563D7A|nr:sigma-70 family RNA polymerase sigma factor [Rhizobium sp. RU20A]SIR18830.1 RNA polymerase sigma-70 factor, ECF subfamily [Rhizobium sp. RU20A]